MNKNIKLADCVILKEDKILLLNRTKTNWFEIPCGKVEENETNKDCVKRELKEELLCDIKIIKKIGSREFIENDNTLNYTWFLSKIANN